MAIGGVVLGFTAKTAEAVRDVGKLDRKLAGLSGTAKKSAGGIGGAIGSIGKAVGSLPLAGTVVAGAVGLGAAFVGMAKSAVDDAAAADKLAASLKKSTKATDKGVDSAEDWINRMQFATGIADDELRPALERAARSTKNLKGAQKLVTLAMDISARTGKPLATVITRLAKANDGNINGLKGLGITLGENATNAIEYSKEQKKLLLYQNQATKAYETSGAKSKEYKTALEKVAAQTKIVNGLAEKGTDWQKELGDSFGGAATEAGKTVAGTWERIKIVFGELGEAVGTAALPPLQTFADWFGKKENIGKVQGWINKVQEWSTAIGTELVGKLNEFRDWLNSPEGKKAIKDFTDRVKTVYDAFMDVVGAIQSAIDWWDRWTGRTPDPYADDPRDFFTPEGGGTAVDPKSHPLNPETNRDPRAPARRGEASYTGPKGGVVININNPKPERGSASVAAALRVTRTGPNGGAWASSAVPVVRV